MLRLALVVFALAANAAFAQSPVERGSYLVNAVMACDGCHTPRGPGGVWQPSQAITALTR